MSEKERILTENFIEYKESADYAFQKNRFNSATTLYFKAMIAIVDLHILKNKKFIPSSHTNRFRILESEFRKIYEIVDRDFPFYQDSYTQKMNKETAELLREDVETIKRITKE